MRKRTKSGGIVGVLLALGLLLSAMPASADVPGDSSPTARIEAVEVSPPDAAPTASSALEQASVGGSDLVSADSNPPECARARPAGTLAEQRAAADDALKNKAPSVLCVQEVTVSAPLSDRAALAGQVNYGSYPIDPPQCSANQSGYAQTCARLPVQVYISLVRISDGAIIGTMYVTVDRFSFWSLTDLGVTDEYFTTPGIFTGGGAGPWSTGGGSYSCSLTTPAGMGCTVAESSFPQITFTNTYPATVIHIKSYRKFLLSATGGAKSLVSHHNWERLTYQGPLPVVNRTVLVADNAPSFVTLCDNAVSGKVSGCKAPTDRWTPTLTYSSAVVPNVVRSIRDAQNRGVPGSPTSGRPLFRATSTATINANRAAACPSRYPRPSGYTCDEYPFASTYQGAASAPTSGITFSYCQVSWLSQTTASPKWMACMVPKSEDIDENGAAGRQLGAFYTVNRILDNDRFYVATQ